jgi:cytochrome c556
VKKSFLALALLALFGGDSALQSQSKSPTRVNQLMHEKLNNAKVLLEGIALADFPKIRRSAETLHQLSKTAEWHVVQTPRYEMYSNEFRRAAEGIIQKAKAKNIDGVTLSYFEMTMSCVRCHAYVREVRDARLRLPPGDWTAFVRPAQGAETR